MDPVGAARVRFGPVSQTSLRHAVILLGAALTLGCGHVTHVRPTPLRQLDVEAALGGPMLQVPGVTTLPIPLVTAGASYGVMDRLDVGGHVHVTSALYRTAGLDAQTSYMLLKQEGAIPALSFTGRLYGFTNGLTVWGAGQVDAAVSYLAARRFLSYLDATAFIPIGNVKTPLSEFPAAPLLWSFALGEAFELGDHWELQLEGRWYSPDRDARNHGVTWVSIAHQGAVGVLLGARYRFGGPL